MLGEALIDLHGIEHAYLGNALGLGLLPLVTVFAEDKTVRHKQTQFLPDLRAPWSALAGVSLSGYEIHHGQTQKHVAMAVSGNVARAILPDGLGWRCSEGHVLGLYLHGLFEDPRVIQALFGAQLQGPVPTLDTVFDGLADFVGTHFGTGVLQSLLA
jgi:adenosylcobyric acid synthase